MAPLEQLNAYLEGASYLGSAACATLEDYKQCKGISGADAQKYPHLRRWHAHVSELMAKYPVSDCRGHPVPPGSLPNLGGRTPEAAPKTEAAPKKGAAPKTEAAPKKDEAAKEAKADAPPSAEDLEKARKDKLRSAIRENVEKARKDMLKSEAMSGLDFFCSAMTGPSALSKFLTGPAKVDRTVADFIERHAKIADVGAFASRWSPETYQYGVRDEVVAKLAPFSEDMDGAAAKLQVARLRTAWRMAQAA